MPVDVAEFHLKSTVPVSQHGAFKTGFEEVINYFKTQDVQGFIVEEVKAFGDYNKSLGTSYLQLFMAECEKLGFAVVAMHLNSDVWVEMPRSRIYIVGCKASQGHVDGIKFIAEAVEEAVGYRKINKPTPIVNVIGFDAESVRRREEMPVPGLRLSERPGGRAGVVRAPGGPGRRNPRREATLFFVLVFACV